MFFISAGFVLIMGGPVLLTVPFLLVPSFPSWVTQFVTNSFEVAGLLCIIYALRVEP